MPKRKTPKPIGGGWYLLGDGSKVQGREKAYRAAGLDPKKAGNRRSDAAKQRRRKTTIEDRRQLVAGLLVNKVPYREIAQSLKISLSTVADDVDAIRTEWRDRAARDVADYVVEELAALDEDEYKLRLRYNRTAKEETRLRIFDRILGLRDRRNRLLGLDAPTVQRVVLSASADDEHGGERVVFRAGGSKEQYIAALRASQGQLPEETERRLTVVDGVAK